jgi:hypothetical protein
MNLNTENPKPSKCPRCNFEFPDDNMRWPLYNINKHIKSCENKHEENEKSKKSQKSMNFLNFRRQFYIKTSH